MNERIGNITGEQKTRMVSFLEGHPELISSKFTSTFSFKAAQTLWKELAEILNAVPGAQKDWSQWRKTWHDMRTKTKSKKTAITRSCEKTGGGPPLKEIMSSNEQQVVNLIRSTTIFGDPTTEESEVAFSFEAELQNGQSNNGANNEENVASVKFLASRTPTKIQYKLKASVSQRTASGSKIRSHTSGRRLDETVKYTKAMMESSTNELEARKAYYSKMLELQERDVVAKERIARAVSSYCGIAQDTEEESVINDVEWLEESLLE